MQREGTGLYNWQSINEDLKLKKRKGKDKQQCKKLYAIS